MGSGLGCASHCILSVAASVTSERAASPETPYLVSRGVVGVALGNGACGPRPLVRVVVVVS